MKNKHYTTLLVVFMLFAFACKKSNSSGDDVTPTAKKYLIQSTVKFNAPGIGIITTTTNYTYDSKKRKATEKAGNSTFNYVYYDNDLLFSSNQILGDGNAMRYLTEYKYTGTLIAQTKVTTYKNNENVSEIISNYTYNSSNQLIKIDYYVGLIKTYTYDNKGDLVKTVDKQAYNTLTIEYTYDADHRKITETQTTVANDDGSTVSILSYAYAYDSRNNVTKLVTTMSGKTATVNTTYIYDVDGYMTSYTKDDGGSATFTYTTL
jgi:hypothetical protein